MGLVIDQIKKIKQNVRLYQHGFKKTNWIDNIQTDRGSKDVNQIEERRIPNDGTK